MAKFEVTFKRSEKQAIDPKTVTDEIRKIVEKYAKKVQDLYLEDTATWRHQPDFPIRDISEGGDYTLNIQADGPNARQFNWVDLGTEVRFATMTSDFIPKTSPGVIGSGPGQGGVAYVRKDMPRPGIEARHFGEEIVEELQEAFLAEMRQALGLK